MAGNGQFSQDHDVTVYTSPIFCCIYSDLEWILVTYLGCLLLDGGLAISGSTASTKRLFFFSYAIQSDLRITYLSSIKRA